MQTLSRLTWSLVALLLFLSASALYGGYSLTSDPTGRSLQMSTQLLVGTPFTDFLVPGLFLFICLGIGALVSLLGLVVRAKWCFLGSFGIGLALVCWILIQVALVGYSSWLQPVYAMVGILIAALSYGAYRNSPPRNAA